MWEGCGLVLSYADGLTIASLRVKYTAEWADYMCVYFMKDVCVFYEG